MLDHHEKDKDTIWTPIIAKDGCPDCHDETIVKISDKEALEIKGTTDWEAFDALTDEQIAEAAKTDPGSAHPSDEELKKFKRTQPKKTRGEINMAAVKLQGIVAKNLRDKTDWERLKQITDTEIKAAVATDPAMRVIDDSDR